VTEKGVWYQLAAETLHRSGVRNEVTGESYLDLGAARAVLGESLRVSRLLQMRVIHELVEEGLVEWVNARTISVAPPRPPHVVVGSGGSHNNSLIVSKKKNFLRES